MLQAVSENVRSRAMILAIDLLLEFWFVFILHPF